MGRIGGITLAHKTLVIQPIQLVNNESHTQQHNAIRENTDGEARNSTPVQTRMLLNPDSSVSKKVEVPLRTPWTLSLGSKKNPICIKSGEENTESIDIDRDTSMSCNITSTTPPTKSKNLVKIIYYSKEGHKARVEKSKRMIDKLTNANLDANKVRIPWESTRWNPNVKKPTIDNNIGTPTNNNLGEVSNGASTAIIQHRSLNNKNPPQKKLQNKKCTGKLPMHQKQNDKIFSKSKQAAPKRSGEISHVLDYRSQRIECTYSFDSQVSVTSAGATEPQSTISIAAEYKIRSSILK